MYVNVVACCSGKLMTQTILPDEIIKWVASKNKVAMKSVCCKILHKRTNNEQMLLFFVDGSEHDRISYCPTLESKASGMWSLLNDISTNRSDPQSKPKKKSTFVILLETRIKSSSWIPENLDLKKIEKLFRVQQFPLK
jgi:hypothetical protein